MKLADMNESTADEMVFCVENAAQALRLKAVKRITGLRIEKYIRIIPSDILFEILITVQAYSNRILHVSGMKRFQISRKRMKKRSFGLV